MGPWPERLALILLDASLASALLQGIVVSLMIVSRQPVRRCLLARMAILGSLLLPVLVATAPVPRISLARCVQPFKAPNPPMDEGEGLSGFDTERFLSQMGRTGPSFLCAAYAIGATLGIAWLGLGYLGLLMVLKGSSSPSSSSRSLYESLPYEGPGRRPRLRVSGRVHRPVLAGLTRPTILIPPGLDRSGEIEPLRLTLLHELVHAERFDPWFALLGGLAQAIWFFLPPIWWLRVQMRLDQEFLADRHASDEFGPFGAYASSLVAFAGGTSARPVAIVSRPVQRIAGPAKPVGSSLFLRVLMLVRCPFPMESRPPFWWRWSLLPGLAVLTVALSGLTLRSHEAAASPSPPTGPNVFSVPSVVVEASPPGPDGRGRLYTIPLRMPSSFDLSVEVLADLQSLSQIRIAGFLVPVPPSQGLAQPPEVASWHRIQLRRSGDKNEVRIDDLSPSALPNMRPTPWLSLQSPASQRTEYRNLSVSW